MKKTKFTFTIIFTLLTGFIIGAIVTYFLTKPNLKKFNFQKHHAMMVEKMVNDLALNKQQKQDFYDIHIKHLARMCSLLQKTKPNIIKIIEGETKEMKSILTPEQQKKFEEIRAQKIDRFKTRFANLEIMKKQFPQK